MAYGKATVMGPVMVGTIIYIIVCFVGNGSGNVQATHFRGGTISWKPSDSFSLTYKEIIFTFKLGWRLSRIGCDERTITSGALVGEDARWFCMYGCKGVVASTREKCTEFNMGDDWMYGSNTFKHVFETDGPIEISYMECCWLTDLVVGAGGEWALTTTLNLGIRSDTGGPNSSPVTAMAPMITLRAGVPDVIDLAVRDSDGDRITCRLGRHVGECGTICSLFAEFTLDEENCLIRYTPVSNTTGKIPVAIMVEDHHRSIDGIVMGKKTFAMTEALSAVPMQFLVILDTPPSNCSEKPLIEASIPPSEPVKIRPGKNFTFTVTGTPCDVTSSIEEFILIAPIGVRKSPTTISDGVYRTDITWTPIADQDGSNLICVRARSSNGILSEQVCITAEVPKATAFCAVVGGSHFITFDKSRYNFFGMCTYKLVGTLPTAGPGLTPFNVTLTNEETPAGHSAVQIGTVEAQALGQKVTVDSQRNVYLNDIPVNLPIRMKSGLRVEKSGRGVSIALTLAIRIYVDGATLSVQLPQNYGNYVEGLCGNYNGEADDDLTLRGENVIASDETEFTTSFQIDADEEDRCFKAAERLRDEPECNEQTLNKATSQCNILIEKEDGCFIDCHDVVDPQHFYDNCISVFCHSSDDFTALDVLIRAYADVCQREGVTVCDWRERLGITMECAPNSHYEKCSTTVPATCADSMFALSPTPSKSCIEGCVCNKGYILSGTVCVPESECGCIINDIYYPKGFTYRTDDCERECVCGEDCRKVEPCDGRSKCVLGSDGFHRCIERQRNSATCKAVTDPHYQTFDGTMFDSMGTCAYIMVRSKRNATKATAFTVVAVNEQSKESKNASHVREVHVHFGDGHTITLGRGHRVILNDKEINPGSSIYGVEIRRVGRWIVADFNFGLVVRWDGVDMLRITAWSPLRYMVEGLCGDWDGNPENDFAVRPTDENVPDPGSFAESWRIQGYGTENCYDFPGTTTVQPPCEDEASLARYQDECRGLIDPKGAFEACHSLVDPMNAYNNCIFDLCVFDGDQDLKERIFSSYADDCLDENGIPPMWRDAENLTEVCVNGIFSACMEQCQPTCSDPTAAQCLEKRPNQLGERCAEGCICQEGTLLSGNKCVPPEECGCMVNGRYEERGFAFAIASCAQTCICEGPDNLVCAPTPGGCVRNRDSCQQRDDGYFQCVQRPRRRATCKAVTDPHYMTFDRKNFDSMGTCNYIMVRSKEESGVTPFRVVTVNEQPWPNRTVSHVKEAWIHVGDDLTISMKKGGVITINGRTVEPGTSQFGVNIRKIGRFWIADFPDIGFYVKWDGEDRIRISVWSNLRGLVEGLCGDFDDDETNDFVTPDGELVENITTFVNSWKVDGYDNEECRDPVFDTPEPQCSDTQRAEYETICGTLSDPNGPYADCLGVVDPEPFIQNCVFDLCAYNGDSQYKERIFSEFVEECLRNGILTIPGNWRELDNLVTFECTENSHAEGSIDQCQPTCTDPDGSRCRAAGTIGTEPVEGCVCNEGYIWSGGKCVLESECGCVAEDGSYFQQGFIYRTANCSTECECRAGGVISCYTVDGCPKGDRCRMDTDGYKRCIAHIRRRATCKAVTDPHYMTFDGINYDSMGTCAYIMARSKEDSGLTPFRVVAVNEKGNANQTVSHVKEIYVHVGDDITLTMKAGPIVAINGEVVLPGTTVDGIEIRQVGRFTVAEFPFGLFVRWDGIDRLRIMAYSGLKGKMEGLCGDFNDDPSNDFTTSTGTIETNVTNFVNSWKVSGYDTQDCVDPPGDLVETCDTPEKLEAARRDCNVLIDPDGPFRPCFGLISPNDTFDNCVVDVCAYGGDSALRERIISSFVEDCIEEAVADEIPDGGLSFRDVEEEELLCDENSHFETCAPTCQPTCSDKDTSICRSKETLPTSVCVEGCVCNEGFIRSGTTCIREEDCGCEIDGRYVEKGYMYNNRNCTVQCTCVGKEEVSCVSTEGCEKGYRCRLNDQGRRACIPHIRRRATCKAVTDPHYMTFDGKNFDSMGTCAYIMTQTRRDSTLEETFSVIAINERGPATNIVSHVKEVHIFVGRDMTVTFTNESVKIDGEVVLPGTRVSPVTLRRIGKFLVAEFDFGLVVKWDAIDRLRIMAWGNLKGQVEGICGDFDDDPENDFVTPNGRRETNITRFVRSWRSNRFSVPDCFEPVGPGTLNDTVCVDPEVHARYYHNCSILTAADGPYRKCHDGVDPTKYFEDCLHDMCSLDGDRSTFERNTEEYAAACLEEKNITIEDDTPSNCPQNTTSVAAMEQCQPTCNDPDASICKANSTLTQQPVPGCKCDDGLLASGNRCVPPDQCGCLINNKYREIGFIFLNEKCDEECECLGVNDVVCRSREPCPTTERCTLVNQQYQCTLRVRTMATCKAITDPHYTTFDGRVFDSSAWCAYTMVQGRKDSDAPDFSVVAVNDREPLAKSSSRVSSVIVSVGNDLKVVLSRGQRVKINGVRYSAGSNVNGTIIRQVGLFTVVEFPFGLVIRWDLHDRLRVTVWDQLKGKVEGMCGNYNDDMEDDFTMNDGRTTNDVDEFVSSWHSKGKSAPKCTHGQDADDVNDCSDPEVRAGYEDECNVLLDPDGPFAECHRVAEAQHAYDACVSDLCTMDGDLTYKDRVFASYVHDCNEFSRQPEPWRLDENLPIACRKNSKYVRCMHQCQPTCTDPDGSLCKKKLPFLLGEYCVEGCKCNSGYILSNDKCVLDQDCGCMDNGVYYEKGFKFMRPGCEEECECRGPNDFVCREVPDGCLTNRKCKTAAGGNFQCMPGARKKATCRAITDPHYTSFDGLKFDSQGPCSYIMTRSKPDATVDQFMVVAVNGQPKPKQRVSHVKEAHVDFRGHRLSFYQGQRVELDGEVVNAGTQQSGMELRMSGRFLAARFDFGLTVKWDGADRLRVTVKEELRGELEGVCGDFDDDPTNDLLHAISGEIVNDPEDFVNSWRILGFNDDCAGPLADFLSAQPPFECGTSERKVAEEACAVLINPEGALKNCRRVADSMIAFENCVLDMCAYAGDVTIHDRVISDFSDDCREEGGELESNWREEANLTQVECSEHSHFEACMDDCQPTCWDIDASQCKSSESDENCVEGCVADEGYVISGNEYVHYSECGCFKDNRYYKNGESFYTEGCKTFCECNAGVVTCETSVCAREEECMINSVGKRDCVTIEKSTCQAWGSTHFTSFDGRTFEMTANCNFILARREVERGDPSSRLEAFAVTTTVTQSDDDIRLSEARVVRVRLPTQGITVLMRPDAQARIGGQLYHNWRSSDESRLVTVDRRGSFTVLTTFFGLEVQYDGNNIRITLPNKLSGKIEGICGNYNGDPEDDFYLKDDAPNQNIDPFMLTYSGSACSDSHELLPHICSDEERSMWSSPKKCGAIIDPNSEFASCSKKLDAQKYFDKCLQDVCRSGGSSDVLGQAIKTFAHECLAINEHVCNWRRDLMIQIACPVNSHYVGCTSGCEHTCGAADDEECRHQLVEDCACDEGYIRSNGQCVAMPACGGCLIKRKMMPKGFTYRPEDCNKLCTCVGNDVVECEEAPGCISRAKCGKDEEGFLQCLIVPRRKAVCQAFGSGHFISFDGTQFNSSATCTQTMARSKSGATILQFSVKIDMQPAKNPDLSSVAQVIIETENYHIIMAQGRTVMVNGRNVAIGSVLETVAIRKIGGTVAAVFEFGMTVRWDGRGNVRIVATRPLAGQVEGLCGDFDEDEMNDFTTPLGVLESDASVFVNSWRDSDINSECRLQKPVKSPCDSVDSAAEYRTYCQMKYYTNTAKCSLFEHCVFEMCASGGDKKYIESTIYTFYQTCNEKDAPDTSQPVPAMECPKNSHFVGCMSKCQATCSDQDATVCLEDENLKDGCVLGCQCNQGYVLDGEVCVKPTDCGCVGSEGEYYPNNYDSYLEDCDRKCQCNNGDLRCEETRCFLGQYCGYREDTYGCHWEDKCKYNNGGCDQLCSWTDGAVVCSCREGYNITSDGMKCKSTAPDCDETKKNFTKWKSNTMQAWINKLDAYMNAMKEGSETGQPAHVCKTIWTDWFDVSDPDESGDDESMSSIRVAHPDEICENPVSVQAQLTDGRAAHASGLILRTMSPSEGLQCFNSDQREGETCGDFRIRFLCLEELI